MNYPWLYFSDNYIGQVNWKKLKIFYDNNFDHVLGWEPKPNSLQKELIGKNQIDYLKFNDIGIRTDNNVILKESEFVIFGDSYALSRQVSDQNSISHLLGKKINRYIPNYGVGNYGIDQSFLRFKKYQKKLDKKKMILIIVPETLIRMNTIWRHFHETGNIFGFKGRFFVENKQLKYKKNPIKNFNDYDHFLKEKISNNHELMNDPMFIYRFKNEVFDFKKLFLLNKHTITKAKEIIEFKYKKKYLKSINDTRGLSIRMKYNSKFVDLCYKNSKLTKPFELLLKKFNKELNGNLYIFFIPQLSDLRLKTSYYIEYLDNLKEQTNIKIYNASNYITNTKNKFNDFSNLYIEKGFGGHLSNYGNDIISQWIFSKL